MNWLDPEKRYEKVQRIKNADKYKRLEQLKEMGKLEEAKNFIDLEAYSPEKKRQDDQQKMLEELDLTKEEYEVVCKYGDMHKI